MAINTLSDSLNIGSGNTASGLYSFAQGSDCTVSGNNSHAEGSSTIASGVASHAEGVGATADGNSSHAEGFNTTASGYYSHAEGAGTKAKGQNSHAEGYFTRANGEVSHAEGNNTIANNRGEHASGYYNNSISGTNQDLSALTVDSSATLFSIGNGTTNTARKNAFEVKWNGDAYLNGSSIYVKKNDGTTIKLQDLLDKII